MRACEKTTQTLKKYTNFFMCFLILFFTKVCKPRQNTNILDQKLSAASENDCRVDVTHESVAKTNKIDVLVTHVKPAKEYKEKCKGKSCVFFSGFLGKVYARAEVKHTIYFERPYCSLLHSAKPSP